MSDVNAVTSPTATEATPAVGTSDGKKSGNVSFSMIAQLMQKSAQQPSDEKIAGDVTPPIKTGETTPAAEVQSTSRATESQPEGVTPPAQTEQTEVKPEGQDEAETPTDLSQLSNLDPKTKALVEGLLQKQKDHIQEMVNKRIGKEVAKTKALEEQLGAIRQQAPAQVVPPNGMLPAPTPAIPQFTPVADVPLAEIHDVNALAAKRQEADTFRQKADDALALGPDDNGRFTIDGETLSKEQVIAVRRNATKILNVDVPQRFQYLQTRQQAVQAAYAEFPWMKDQQSPEYQQASAILNQTPWLRNMPNAELIVGYHLEGLKVSAARKKAAEAPAAKPAPKPKPPSDQSALGGGSAATGRASADTRSKQALSVEIGKLGSKGRVSVRDTATFLARKDQLSQSR